jgi:hypothetical protein
VDLNPSRGYSPCDAATCHARPVERPNGPRLGGPVQNQSDLAGPAAQCAHAAQPRRGGAAANGSPLPASWCGLAGEDEESLRSTPEVATRTGTHRRRVSMMRWFSSGETSVFGHQRRRPNTQRWLVVAYKTGGRMGMRRRGVNS